MVAIPQSCDQGTRRVTPTHDQSPPTEPGEIARRLKLGEPHRRSIRHGRRVVAITLAVAVVSLFLWIRQDESPGTRYRTAEVTRGSLTVTVSATGTLQPVNQVQVGSEVSGTIREVAVDINDRVEQGDVLAVLDTDQFEARVKQARASLELAQAQVRQAQATETETASKLRRTARLVEGHLVSEEELDTAQASYDRAVADVARSRAQVAQAQAALDAEEVLLAKATIRSPIQGIVLSRNVEPGQTVAASFQTPVLFTLAENLTQMELHVNVDEADVGQVMEGQSATFTVDAYPDRQFPARITEVHFASLPVAGVVTYETVLSVDNSELLLRPGMTATAEITVAEVRDATLVPNAALRFAPPVEVEVQRAGNTSLLSRIFPRPARSSSRGNQALRSHDRQQRVWVLDGGEPVAVPVEAGASDGISTVIVSGELQPGAAVVVDTISAGS